MTKQFSHKKSLGQHFLTSNIVPQWMCDAADLKAGEVVLEVGPGTGMLTRELLKRGTQVIALEADQRAVVELTETFATDIASGNLTVHHHDVRDLKLYTIDGLINQQYKVVANIPYYLSGFLFRLFLESSVQPRTLVFLVQKEVAKRVTSSHARGEKESLLSLSAQAYGSTRYVKTVTRGHFAPPPQVDSAIVAITDISKQAFTTVSEADFFTILHLGFAQKRKQLLGNLAAQYPRDQLVHIFSTIGLPETVRAEDIDCATWFSLVEKIIHNPSTD